LALGSSGKQKERGNHEKSKKISDIIYSWDMLISMSNIGSWKGSQNGVSKIDMIDGSNQSNSKWSDLFNYLDLFYDSTLIIIYIH
jgi:hypothetical protein